MRRFVLLSGAAAAAIGAAIALGPTTAASANEPLCRRAPALAQLPAEIVSQQQQSDYEPVDAARPELTSPSPVVTVGEAPPPPPPPPPPPAARAERSEEIAVTGSLAAPSASKSRRSDVATASPPGIEGGRMYRPPEYVPPAGLLTAGDHDDLLNPLLYARYVARAARELGQTVSGLPRVDTRRTLTVSVADESGRPVPFTRVTVKCADGNQLNLATLADGRVVLFPALDQLGSRVTIEAGGVRRSVAIDQASGGQEQQLVIGSPARPVRNFDLMIALDSTGSMGDEIEFLKSELGSILADIQHAYPDLNIRVGLVSYRDIGDDYVTRTDPLTSNFSVIEQRLGITRGTGGGDMPEAMDQALIRAVGQNWRPDAVKTLLLVADAPPHDDLQGRAFAAAEAARARRVQIVPIAASGVDDRAEYFMRAVAAATQSRYIFLTDDSGIGNPHAEPDVDCYVVTQLATAIRRVLASQISGERLEPNPGEVIRVVGRYDHGKCVLPRDFRVQ
jgi:Mg-chelatase subunit ChlD